MNFEVPPGWIFVSSFDLREDKSSGGATGSYALILRAIKKNEIDYMAVGRPKRWLVQEDQATRYLAAHSAARGSGECAPASDRVIELLEKILAICESLK